LLDDLGYIGPPVILNEERVRSSDLQRRESVDQEAAAQHVGERESIIAPAEIEQIKTEIDPDLGRIVNRHEVVQIQNLITCAICLEICLTEQPYFC
jgi:hypothetical protein